jgi:hypothetical protein
MASTRHSLILLTNSPGKLRWLSLEVQPAEADEIDRYQASTVMTSQTRQWKSARLGLSIALIG